MNSADLENEIREQWDYWNREGIILYQFDTLTTRTINHGGTELHLIHNACRDVYDWKPKSIDKSGAKKKPFTDGSNPELLRTKDDQFKIIGNRFACMQYQSVLVPVETQNELTIPYLEASLQFAVAHPNLTMMYNALNAGKTVPHQYWLLSFHAYKTLESSKTAYKPLGQVKGVQFYIREEPCYMLTFDVQNDLHLTAECLYDLVSYMNQRSFNMFLFANRVYFIPREEVEIPAGFENHRFGGLEMIGYFIMKSLEALETVVPDTLLNGIQQISYKKESQAKLERYLLHELQ